MMHRLNKEMQNFVLLPVREKAVKGGKGGKKRAAFGSSVRTGQQFDPKWEWQRGPLCKIEPNSTGSMLNHV